MPNGGMPVFTLIATGWRYRKIFFYKKALPPVMFVQINKLETIQLQIYDTTSLRKLYLEEGSCDIWTTHGCVHKLAQSATQRSYKPPRRLILIHRFPLSLLFFSTITAPFPSSLVATICKASLLYRGFFTLPFSSFLSHFPHSQPHLPSPSSCLRLILHAAI